MPLSSRANIATRFCPRSERVGGDPARRVAVMARVAREGAAHPEVRAAARACWSASSVRATVGCVAALVQALPYQDDDAGTDDVVRAPCETLRVGGDCDCRATLCAALCEASGVLWRLAWIVQPGAPLDHVALQVMVAGRWQWLDVTVPGAQLGEHPREAVARLGYSARVTGGSQDVGH